MTLSEAISLEKAKLWEEAKGKLRAMVAVEGQCSSHGPEHAIHRDRWLDAEAAIEKFVRDFEDNALHV